MLALKVAISPYFTLMPRTTLQHCRAWVFDLDNTLYPPSARLFDQIEARMTAYVMDALGVDAARADHLRHHYWETHGTTLAGLMAEHALDPEPYLVDVHDISLAQLQPDADLRAGIDRLPGRRIVYTNGSAPYARRVIGALGLDGLFDAVYGIEDAGYFPKPRQEAFATIFGRDGLDCNGATMFEDDARNLAVPHAMGMHTVHVAETTQPEPHIRFHTQGLSDFLQRLAP